MKQHFVVQAIMKHWKYEFQCPMGAFCTKEDLGVILKGKGVKSYKIKAIDDEPVADWEKTEWVSV